MAKTINKTNYMRPFNKEQIEFIQEKLKKQRVICMNEMLETGYSSSVKEAPEPELPEPVEDEPYGWIYSGYKHRKSQDVHKDISDMPESLKINMDAVYLHPAPIVFPTEEEIEIIRAFLKEANCLMDFCIDSHYLDNEDLTDGQISFNKASDKLFDLIKSKIENK